MNWHLLTVLHAIPTVAMAGVIWFVQIVHYPLYRMVGPEQFVAYERQHCRTISFVVMPLMLAEVAVALALLILDLSAFTGLNLALIVAVWLITFTVQVPLHQKLLEGKNLQTIELLVRGNWWRVVVWGLKALIGIQAFT